MIVVIGKVNLLKGMADELFEFKDMGEFKEKLKNSYFNNLKIKKRF